MEHLQDLVMIMMRMCADSLFTVAAVATEITSQQWPIAEWLALKANFYSIQCMSYINNITVWIL